MEVKWRLNTWGYPKSSKIIETNPCQVCCIALSEELLPPCLVDPVCRRKRRTCSAGVSAVMWIWVKLEHEIYIDNVRYDIPNTQINANE